MKKIIALLLTAVIFAGMASVTVFAESENLIENPSFEDGIYPWSAYGAEAEESTEAQDGDEYSVLVTKREEKHSSIIYDALKIIKYNGAGKYKISAYVKVKGTGEMKLAPIARVADSSGKKYLAGSRKTVTPGEWTKIELTFNIEGELSEIGEVKIYFTGEDSEKSFCDFYIDNVSFTKLDPIVTPVPTPSVTASPVPVKTDVLRTEKTRVGAIRWDAYYETEGNNGVSDQVAACLSPAKYHWTAPFFSNVTEDNKISFPEYTMEIFEKECDYAIQAGIDYFAYVWYDSFNKMSKARSYHTESSKHDQIQMCAIIEKIYDDKAMNDLFEAMKQSYYLKVDGMPVLYVFKSYSVNFNFMELSEIRSMAANAGVTAPLYIVQMESGTKVGQEINTPSLGYDAVSFYGMQADSKGMAYTDIAKAREDINEKTAQKYRGSAEVPQMIPAIELGKDTRSRIETGVSWTGDYGGNFAYSGTPEEIAQHTLNVLQWMLNNKDVTEANAVIAYAWNEHDEGGWLCPTLKVDEDGKLILDENGNKQANTEILDAVKGAIEEYRLKESGASAEDKNNVPSTPPNSITSYIVTAVVSAIAGSVITSLVFVIVGKKKRINK